VAPPTDSGTQLGPSLCWAGNEVTVGSEQELNALLDQLTAAAEADLPFMVAVARPDGSTLSIGLGREESVATHVPGSLDPPYLSMRGDPDRTDPIEFVSGGEMTEFAPRSAVPLEAARRALIAFFRTGELSPEFEWEEV
jgi:hypothetical protein